MTFHLYLVCAGSIVVIVAKRSCSIHWLINSQGVHIVRKRAQLGENLPGLVV